MAATESSALLTVAEAADVLGVSENWVRLNLDALGAVRLREGARSPIRIPSYELSQRLQERQARKIERRA